MRVHKKWRPRVLRSLKAVKQRRLEALKAAEEPPAPATPKITTPRKNKYYSEKTCEICERKFVNGKTLSKHIKTVHNKIKPFNCNVCGKKTARKASLIVSFFFTLFITINFSIKLLHFTFYLTDSYATTHWRKTFIL